MGGASGFTPPPLLKVHLKWKCGISKFPVDRILNCIYFCIFPEPCQNIFRVYLKLLEFPLSSIILRLETRVYQFYISASKNQRRGGKLEIYFLYYQTFSAHFILTLMNNYTSRRFKSFSNLADFSVLIGWGIFKNNKFRQNFQALLFTFYQPSTFLTVFLSCLKKLDSVKNRLFDTNKNIFLK